MKAVEFCYWMQGMFEIGDANGTPVTTLHSAAAECIRAHLALVATCDPGHGNAFVSWLAIELDDADEIAPERVTKIRRTLANQFKHEIDPTYEGKPDHLQAIHDGRPPRPGEQAYRC